MEWNNIELYQGWEYIEKYINKIKRILEASNERPISHEECLMLNQYLSFYFFLSIN
jgi:hypothetical protein